MSKIAINVWNYRQPFTLGMCYRVLPPEANDPEGYLRVVPEGEKESYLYLAEWFHVIEVPEEVVTAVWNPPPIVPYQG